MRRIILSILSLSLFSVIAGETLVNGDKLRLYIDCYRCDMNFIRESIPCVDYVRDRNFAQLFIQIIRTGTGGGGIEYQLLFIGKNEFAGKSDTIRFNTHPNTSDDDKRQDLVRYLKLGMVPYISKTSAIHQISLQINENDSLADIADRWNNWVFRVRVHGNMEGEESELETELFTSVGAERITEEWKFRLSGYQDYKQEKFVEDNVEDVYIKKRRGASGMLVKSLGEHWSTGALFHIFSSTYENVGFSGSLTPAVEYNIFPYAESSQKELSVFYQIGPQYYRYNEETVFSKFQDTLFSEALSLNLKIRQPWGQVNAHIRGSHYFHDVSKNRIELRTNLDLPIFRNLSLDIGGRYSFIRDQLSLKKEEASKEEILLGQVQLPTEYKYRLWTGFTFSFGSIYNNVVNTRF